MNAGTGFVAIISLLVAMALAGSTAKKQADLNSPPSTISTPSRIAINHNETLVSDAAVVQQADALSQWLTSLEVFIFTRFSSYAPGGRLPGGCEEFGCGGNHNETMVSDAMSAQQTDSWSQMLRGVEAFVFAPFFSSSAPRDGGCDEWGCGTNHNETMVSDATMVPQADSWSQLLRRVQAFVFAGFASSAPRDGGCDEWGCGSNHNETLARDTVR